LKPAFLRNPRIAAIFTLIFSALIFAAPVFAAEEGAGPEDSFTGWVFRWLNFAIVFAAIAYAFSKAGPYFRAHAEEIQAAVAEGTRAREEAEAKKRDAEARLTNLPAEIEALKVEARRDAEAERERIKAMTREEAAKVERAADIEIAAAERAAVLALKSFAAGLAVEHAEVLLREQINPGSDSVIVSVFVAELAASGSAN
jgi:F-type H+-transporting ATPase subunit b